MAMPKANNDHFPQKTRNSPERNLFVQIAMRAADLTKKKMTISAKTMKFSRQQFIQPNSCESTDLTKIAQISCISRLQGPIPAPSQTKDLQLIEFWPTLTIAHS